MANKNKNKNKTSPSFDSIANKGGSSVTSELTEAAQQVSAGKETTEKEKKESKESKTTKSKTTKDSKSTKSKGKKDGEEKDKVSKLANEVKKLDNIIPETKNEDPSKSWGEQFIHVNLDPDPTNVFGVDFMEDAKEYLYKTLNGVLKNESDRVQGFSEQQWIELLTTYALQNLSEEEKIAKIVTPQNKESFKGLVELFILEDDFRAHILHLCAMTAAEAMAQNPVVNEEKPEEIKEEIKVNTKPTHIDGEEKVHLITKGITVNISDGGAQTIHNHKVPPAQKPRPKTAGEVLRQNPILRIGVLDYINQRKKLENDMKEYKHPLSM